MKTSGPESRETEAIILSFFPTGRQRDNKQEFYLQINVKPGNARNFVTEIHDFLEEDQIKRMLVGKSVFVTTSRKQKLTLKWPIVNYD
ncbi:MAG: hypothetical protein IPL92_11945 [Saprospiraceae bacterium]|nr:hypothetical protein [Candidatus Opimibacter iunctus]